MTVAETLYAVTPDGVHIAYQVTGAGDLDVVLMHGTVAHLEIAWEDRMLRSLYERLGAFARLIRFDRRGMGMSDVLDTLPSFGDQVDDFGAVLDAAGSQSAALVGTGDAGMLALAFAARQPERVTHVVAYETTPRLLPSPNDDYGVELAELQRMAAASASLDLDAHLAIVAPARKDEPGFKPWFRRFTRSAASGFRIENFIRDQMTWDITGLLDQIRIPVLVLNWTGNTILPLRSTRALAAALPNATLAEIEGTGTSILSDEVDAIARRDRGVSDRCRPVAGRIGCWRPCSSPTSSIPRSAPRSSETTAGGPARHTTREIWRALGRFGAARSTRPATASWRRSTCRSGGRCALSIDSAVRPWAWRSGPGSTPARSS